MGSSISPAGPLTYDQALGYVESLSRFGMKLGLERSRAVMAALGHPGQGMKGALIAGTNGKGSTSAFLESILRARGLRTGMTPSPHLRSYTERVQLNAQPMPEDEFAAAVDETRKLIKGVIEELGEPTEFELLTGLAIWWLAPRCDRLVIEVGIGGRLDSTNVLDLGVAVITNVGLDHQQVLGNTVEEIAAEKAGIIKPGNLVVTGASGDALRVVERRAAEEGAGLWRLGQEIQWRGRWLGWGGSELDLEGPGFSYRKLRIGLLGSWQPENAALAAAAAHAMSDVDEESVRRGLAGAAWPGRLHPVGGKLLLDGGHNPAGLRRVVPDVRRLSGGRPVVVVLGAMADKDVAGMMAELRSLPPAGLVCTAAASAGDRAMTPEALAAVWGADAKVIRPAESALAAARKMAGPAGMVLVCGTLYLVGELLPE